MSTAPKRTTFSSFSLENLTLGGGWDYATPKRITNMNNREIWRRSREELVLEIKRLGYPEALGNEIVKNLGSPKAMDRMTVYLKTVKPRKAELVVDEMLAIKSEIEEWRKVKTSREANAHYQEMRYYGFEEE